MTIKVIGAGFSRTGTASMKVALEYLGFHKCYHMAELVNHPEHLQYWEAAAENQPVEWSKVFEGYQAIVDNPGYCLYRALLEYYPDAKVVLTTRDPGKWYDSALSTIYSDRFRASPRTKLSVFFHKLRKVKYHGSEKINLRLFLLDYHLVQQGIFNGRFYDREYAIQAFENHNEKVKRLVPPEKLLVYQVKEGWDPLCKFLDVPVPVVKSFPHVNAREQFMGPPTRIGI